MPEGWDALEFNISANVCRQSFTPSQRALALALAGESYHSPEKVLPEARLVARYPDLGRLVMDGGMPLANAHQAAAEYEQQALESAERTKALAGLRHEMPLLAMQVDEDALTLDQALARVDEIKAALSGATS